MSEIEQLNGLEQEFNKLNTENLKMNGHNEDINMEVTSDSIGNSLDASPSAASASSDNASTASSNTGNIIEANMANLIEETESKEDVIEDNVIEANVANIIEDNKSDISDESTKHDEEIKPVTKVEDSYSYDSVFPSLPTTGTNFTDNNVWNNIDSKLTLSKRLNLTTTQVFHVPVEERRYIDVANSLGTNETNKKCYEIADRYGVKIEICCSKDSSLHIIISGVEEKVIEAKRAIVAEFVKNTEHQVRVPKEQHKFLIGKSGSVLHDLIDKTCTTIQVPKPDSTSDMITIIGPKDGCEQAIHEIQLICEEQSKTGFERLDIPKLYHPWIRGFNNEIANDIAARTGAKINIPPAQIEKDEIAVSGEKDKVEAACAEIKRIYQSKSKVTKLAIQITKSQHKLIIGKNGSTVQEIFKDYDVYVQVPKSEANSETIYLYGEEAKLGAALSVVCAKANSIVNIKIEVASWLHRYLIGEKGSNISKITADYPGTHVKFEADNKITLDGPPEEVEKVKQRLELIVSELKKSMICEELTVDPKYYSQLVGKKYDNVTRLNKEHGVNIRVPSTQDASNIIRIEGAPNDVKKAKVEFMEFVKKVENERSKDIIIEQKYHSNLIGKNGKNLSEIRSKFNDIQIQIPSQEDKSEVVTLRGNKDDVDNCYKYLQKTIKEMEENNFQDEIHIFKQFHRMLIGKQGIFIRKIREETSTRIEVPTEDSDSDSIVLVGKRENVNKARKLIEGKVKELVKVEEDFVEIPHALHTALIGRHGAIIKQIRKECGGVIINFPPETSTDKDSDKIVLKGPREEIDKAKKELVKLAKEKNEMTYSEDVPAKQEYHRFLVGRNGNNVNTLRDQFNVRIIFPSSISKDNNNNKNTTPQSQDLITIIGTELNVKAVRVEIEKTLKNLEEQVTDEVNIDQKWHKNFTAKRAKLINKISDDNCNVKISFPKTDSDVVVLKGPKDAIENAKKQILEIVYEYENQVSIEVPVVQKYHVSLIGKKGINSSQISDQFKVELQFPAKSSNEDNQINADQQNENDEDSSTPASPSKSDIIIISGLRENCESAKEALLALVPISEDYNFPQKFHKHLLENKAEILKDLSNQYNIQINVPKKGKDCNYVTLVGTRENIVQARSGLANKLTELEINNFEVEITKFNPELIPQLRGRQGVEVIKLEKKFNVRIDFSRKGEPDKITIKGLQENVKKCEAFIQQKISDEESKTSQEITIDNRVHSRIIGQKGKAIAKIMDKYKVDVKFNGRNSDVVIVKGSNSEAIDDACDHLKNLEEEYLQDVTERDMYRHPSSINEENGHKQNENSNGFVVNGAPWEASRKGPAPDTANMDLFPTILTAAVNCADGQGQKASWGPRR